MGHELQALMTLLHCITLHYMVAAHCIVSVLYHFAKTFTKMTKKIYLHSLQMNKLL